MQKKLIDEKEEMEDYIFKKQTKHDLSKLKLICNCAISNMSTEKLLEFSIDIIKKLPEDRISEEINVIMKATEHMPYFDEINNKKNYKRANAHEKICSRMKYEYFEKGGIVLHYGDPATKMYILLKGSVNVFVPRDINSLMKETKGNYKYQISDNLIQKIIKFQKIKRPSLQLKESPQLQYYDEKNEQNNQSKSNMSDTDFELDEENLNLSLKETEKEIRKKFRNFFNEVEILKLKKIEQYLGGTPLFYLENPEKFFINGIFRFNLLKTMKPGTMFGEVGLSMKKNRSATVICQENSEFAILTSEDFVKILKNIEKRELENKINFFKEKNIFPNLQTDVAMRFILLFTKQKYGLDNIIYNQGDEANDVFVVKKGEIEMFQKKEIKKNDKIEQSLGEILINFKKINDNRIIPNKYDIIHLTKLNKGEIFGEEEVIKNKKRQSNAVCVSSKLTLFIISKQNFQRIISENKDVYNTMIENIKLKQSHYKKQIMNYIKMRINTNLKTIESKTSKIFPIRRDVNEIKELNEYKKQGSNNLEKKKLTLAFKNKKVKNLSYGSIRLKHPKYENNDKINKIEYIVNKNEKTLDNLLKYQNKEHFGKDNSFNLFKVLLENESNYSKLYKVFLCRRSKYRNYNNSDPLNIESSVLQSKNLFEKIKSSIINQRNGTSSLNTRKLLFNQTDREYNNENKNMFHGSKWVTKFLLSPKERNKTQFESINNTKKNFDFASTINIISSK